jgi:5-methylcytosine-specific restriction endonuclease McrA
VLGFSEPFFLRIADKRLHLADQPIAFCSLPSPSSEDQARPVSVERLTPLDALLARIAAIDAENAGRPPAKIREIAERYERDAELVRLLKHVRGGKCQVCGFTFRMHNGDTYTEAHHLEELANSGLDISRNMLIICANHHRQFHHGVVEIIEHTADQLVVRIDDEVHTVSLALTPPAAAEEMPA